MQACSSMLTVTLVLKAALTDFMFKLPLLSQILYNIFSICFWMVVLRVF